MTDFSVSIASSMISVPVSETTDGNDALDADEEHLRSSMVVIEQLSESTKKMLRNILCQMSDPYLRRSNLYEFITKANGGLPEQNRRELLDTFRKILPRDWVFDISHRKAMYGKAATRWTICWNGPSGTRNQTKMWKAQYVARLLPILAEMNSRAELGEAAAQY